MKVSVEVILVADCELAIEMPDAFKKSTEPFSIQVALGIGTPTKLQSRISVIPGSTILSKSALELTSGASKDKAYELYKSRMN